MAEGIKLTETQRKFLALVGSKKFERVFPGVETRIANALEKKGLITLKDHYAHITKAGLEVLNGGTKPQGRPPTDRGAYNHLKPRQIGRVPDEDWEKVRTAAQASGKTFTEWAMGHLLKAAEKESKKVSK